MISAVARNSPAAPQPAANRFAYALLLVLLIHAVLRGIRTPNLWSATHLLFNYDFGFVKRGLAGALISVAGFPYLYSYQFFFYCSLALFLANLFLLALLAGKGMRVGGASFEWASFVYFSSMGVAFLAHTIGYFDHAALLVALVALAIPRFDLRWALVALFLPLSVLLHETGFVIFGPVIAYVFVLDVCRSPTRARMVSCLLLLAIGVVTLLVAGGSNLPAGSVEAMYEALRARSEYPLRREAFEVLSRDLAANVAVTTAARQGRVFVAEFVISLVVTLPAIAFLLGSSIRALSGTGHRRLLTTVASIASLTPLLLHAVAWDSARWNTLTITTSYLVLVATVLHGAPDSTATQPSVPRSIKLIAAAIIGFGLSSTVPLLDGYRVQAFPYLDHLVYLMDVMAGDETFPPKPPDR